MYEKTIGLQENYETNLLGVQKKHRPSDNYQIN